MKYRTSVVISILSVVVTLFATIATPAFAVAVTANNDSFTIPRNTTLTTYPSAWSTMSLGTGAADRIDAATTDAVGNIYIARADRKMKVYTNTGVYTSTWTLAQFNIRASDLKFDSMGHLYVVSSAENKLYRYFSNGSLDISWLGTGYMILTTPAPSSPLLTEIALDNNGNLYVTTFGSNSIKKFSSDGGLISTLTNGITNPSKIAVGPDGKVFVEIGSTVWVYSSTAFDADQPGTSFFGPIADGSYPNLAVDSSGTVFVTDSLGPTSLGPTLMRVLPGSSSPDSSFNLLVPNGRVWLDANDNVYLLDPTNDTSVKRWGMNVLSNDVGTGLTTTPGNITTTPSGTVAMATDGTFVYTPPSGYAGTVTFPYSMSDGSTSATATVSIVVLPDRPGAPTIGTVSSVTSSSATVPWTAPSDGGATITNYTVTPTPACSTCSGLTVTGTPAVSPASVTGLSPSTIYTFTVSATNSAGSGGTSLASGPITTAAAPPSAPTSLAATAGDAQVVLSWSPPSSPGGATVDKYKVEYQPASGTWSTVTAATSTPATVIDLTNGIVYTFRVTAHNSAGYGTLTATTSATPTAPPPPPAPAVVSPGAPSDLSGTAGNSQVALSWTAPSSNGGAAVIGYTVTASPGSRTCVSVSTSCTVTGLTNGTAYTFSIHATNSAGDGTESAGTAALTPQTPPAPGESGCPAGTSTGFSDIDDSFAKDDIGCIEALGITRGTSPTTYSPSVVVNREQMAAFLARTWRSLGGTCQSGVVTPFTDIAGSFAETDIGCIWKLKITTGTSATTFSAKDQVTREQMAAFLARLWRALGRTFPTHASTPFTDIYGSFAEYDIGCIRSLGITRGTSATTYSPKDVVSREEMAAFLARTIRTFAT